MSFKSGFVTIVGNPNVGKSSLFNAIIDYNLSIVTSKSQTTRNSIKGILTRKNYLIILSDTPGHVESSYLLHDKMNKNIFSSLDGSDIIIYVTDVNEKLINKKLINSVRSLDIPIFFLVNKKDLYPKSYLDNINGKYVAKDFISTTNKLDIKRVIKKIVERLPEHPA